MSCRRAGLYEPGDYDQEVMEKEMEEDEMENVIGGDYDGKKKINWKSFTEKRIKKMQNNEPQLTAFNTILRATRQEKPEHKLFFLEGNSAIK